MDPIAQSHHIDDYLCPIEQEPLTTAVKLDCSKQHRFNQAAAELLFTHNNDTKCPLCRERVQKFSVDYDTRKIVERIQNNEHVVNLQAPAAEPINSDEFDIDEIEQAIQASLQSLQLEQSSRNQFDANEIEQAMQASLQRLQQEPYFRSPRPLKKREIKELRKQLDHALAQPESQGQQREVAELRNQLHYALALQESRRQYKLERRGRHIDQQFGSDRR